MKIGMAPRAFDEFGFLASMKLEVNYFGRWRVVHSSASDRIFVRDVFREGAIELSPDDQHVTRWLNNPTLLVNYEMHLDLAGPRQYSVQRARLDYRVCDGLKEAIAATYDFLRLRELPCNVYCDEAYQLFAEMIWERRWGAAGS